MARGRDQERRGRDRERHGRDRERHGWEGEGASFLESGIGTCTTITQTHGGYVKFFLLRIQRKYGSDKTDFTRHGHTTRRRSARTKKTDLPPSSLGNATLPRQSGAELSKGVQRRSRGRLRSETRRKIDFIIDKGVTDRRSNISNGEITSILLSSRREIDEEREKKKKKEPGAI